jgi:hypothetical protein
MVIREDMTVMQVRPNYSIVYQFKPQVKFDKQITETKDDFVKHIKDLTQTWKDGDYFIRCSQGTFCYMTLNGRRVKLLKKSKVTGKEYLCWDYFAQPPAKIATKRVTAKKKVVKKVAKKKVAKR